MADVKVTKDLENKQLIIEATFVASKDKLWKAYTEKEQFEKWWGPEGWETTTKEFDFKPGGRVHYCMKCVDEKQAEWFGQESWGMTIIEEIDEFNSYSARDHFTDAEGKLNTDMPSMTLSVEFNEVDGKTTVINRTITETAEQLEELIKMGMVEGFKSQLNRLYQLVEGQGK
jgi:uncharacterized protein YndB with AHSA1/START domain